MTPTKSSGRLKNKNLLKRTQNLARETAEKPSCGRIYTYYKGPNNVLPLGSFRNNYLIGLKIWIQQIFKTKINGRRRRRGENDGPFGAKK